MQEQKTYPIGITGVKWNSLDKAQWVAKQVIARSYQKDVVEKLIALKAHCDVDLYGELNYSTLSYPLFVLKTQGWQQHKKVLLVTGGVHGYETSGILGAIRFMETQAAKYVEHFNIIVAPCVSPWGYETINRWNPEALDPNRSFIGSGLTQESAALTKYLATANIDVFVHIDLHETTNTDNSEFRPALAARDGVMHDNWNIPDGFYLVGNNEEPAYDFQQAIIAAVEKVTHIAPPDATNKLIGVPLEQWGVINYAAKKLGLCMGLTKAKFVTTTEVYPDSPTVDQENCIVAQVAAITGGLDFLIDSHVC